MESPACALGEADASHCPGTTEYRMHIWNTTEYRIHTWNSRVRLPSAEVCLPHLQEARMAKVFVKPHESLCEEKGRKEAKQKQLISYHKILEDLLPGMGY